MIRHRAVARLIVMGILIIGLLIPITWVESIVDERASRRDEVVRDVSSTWGGPLIVAGVVLSVPYAYTIDQSGHPMEVTGHAHILPTELHIDAPLRTESRNRGIFSVAVYQADLVVQGRFAREALTWLRPAANRIDWSGAVLSVGLSDPRALSKAAALTWNGRSHSFTAGTAAVGLFNTGIQAKLPDTGSRLEDTDATFAFSLSANGTREVRFTPAADDTTVSVRSTWPDPSFVGRPLPRQKTVDASGFTASWQVPNLSRSFPDHWTDFNIKDQSFAERQKASIFGIDLIQSVDVYRQAGRAVKYAVLFFLLTFMVFFLWEILGNVRLHPIQYAFIGFALCIFYLLLVSVSEHLSFGVAYCLASAAVTLLIGGYSLAVLRGWRQAASVVTSLSGLYGFLYLLLRLEDFALLAGSVGLLVALGLLMFVTRRMDWYEVKLEEASNYSEAS